MPSPSTSTAPPATQISSTGTVSSTSLTTAQPSTSITTGPTPIVFPPPHLPTSAVTSSFHGPPTWKKPPLRLAPFSIQQSLPKSLRRFPTNGFTQVIQPQPRHAAPTSISSPGVSTHRPSSLRRLSVLAPISFDYAVIRVVPRVEREEFVNAGVIVFCLQQRFLEASIHLDDQRLRALWPEIDLDLVRNHVEASLASAPQIQQPVPSRN